MNKRQKRASKIAAQQALVNGARSAGREMTAEEQAQFDALQREIDTLTAEIEAEERAAAPAEPAAPAENPDDIAQRAMTAERERITAINDLCRDFGEDATEHIRAGHTVEQVRAAILDNMRRTNAPLNVNVVRDEEETFRQRAVDGMMLKAGVRPATPADGAEQFRNMSLRDLAIECLVREGKSDFELRRMSGDDLYYELNRQFYNPSAAFPAIMDQTIRKSLVQLYNAIPTTFEQITTKGSLRDFKASPDHEYVIGGVGDFLKVPENGEIKADAPRTELLPTRKLDTYGKQFSMTRQAFINDDVGFLTEVPGLYAKAAKRTIDKHVYKILFDNPAIFDGVALFHASHKNLIATGSKPTQASIQEMILKMKLQTDHFDEPIYMTPRTIVVPVGYSFDLDVILHSAQVVGSNNNDYNPLYKKPLQVVESPLLNAMAGANACPWFMLADTSSARGIQVDYLNGQEIPTVRRMETSGTLGFTWDIYLDWGIAVRDFRGIYKNPGVAIA